MIFALLDYSNNLIYIFSENGIQAISFNDINYVNQIVNNQPIFLITDLQKKSVSDIYNLISNDNATNQNYQKKYIQNDTTNNDFNDIKNLFVHSSFGIVLINDMGNDGKTTEKFNGTLDFKPLVDLLKNGFSESRQAKSLLQNERIKIVSREDMEYIKNNYDSIKKQRQDDFSKKAKQANEALFHEASEINFDSSASLVGYGPQLRDGVIEINLDKAGRNLGSRTNPNESSLHSFDK